MNTISPKIEIINYFDNLTNRVDIEIDQCLEKYNNNEQVLGEVECFRTERKLRNLYDFRLNFFYTYEPTRNKTKENWPESTKVVDYLNQVRMRTIDELRKAQEESLEYYKCNRSNFKPNDQLNDDLLSRLFKEKFYFQLLYKPLKGEESIWNFYTFCLDFYMSQSDINVLEKFINAGENDSNVFDLEPKLIFDEKMVQIGLVYKHFFDNLKTQKLPNNVIQVRKKDISNIQNIHFNYSLNGIYLNSSSIDLSKLEKLDFSFILQNRQKEEIEEVKLEGLSSLKYLDLNLMSLERTTIEKLVSLRALRLTLKCSISSDIVEKIFNDMPNIEDLSLSADFSYFNLDKFANLKSLFLFGSLHNDFNFNLLKNLCHQLENIWIGANQFDDENIAILFKGRFPKLTHLGITNSHMSKLEKKFLDKFPMLRYLTIQENEKIKNINRDVFSNLKHLTSLDLSFNSIESLDEMQFAQLKNLETLNLSGNRLKTIHYNMFSSLKKLRLLFLASNKLSNLNLKSFVGPQRFHTIDLSNNELRSFNVRINKIENISLSGNSIRNKKEILTRFKDSKINFK